MFIPVATACGILLLGLWLPATTPGPIIAFAALYGLFSGTPLLPVPSTLTPMLTHPLPRSHTGAFVSLIPTYFAQISPREKLGARLGSVYVVAAAATLAGSPTGGALLAAVDAAHFAHLAVFCGVVMFAGVALLVAAGLAGAPRFRRMLCGCGRREGRDEEAEGEGKERARGGSASA